LELKGVDNIKLRLDKERLHQLLEEVEEVDRLCPSWWKGYLKNR